MGRLLASLRHALRFFTREYHPTRAVPTPPLVVRTEADWHTCADPAAMLRFLSGRASERKLRLYAAACCRLIWSLLTDTRSRDAVEVDERFADGLASKEELRTAVASVGAAVGPLPAADSDLTEDVCRAISQMSVSALTALAARSTVEGDADLARVYAVFAAIKAAEDKGDASVSMDMAQVAALKDIFGNPFVVPLSIEPAVLAWNERLVVRLAQSIYDDRRLPEGTLDEARLVVLGDAMEEAGCMDLEVLSHCRNGGRHWRGCWVIDRILGKK
jgi:hypothetical protein